MRASLLKPVALTLLIALATAAKKGSKAPKPEPLLALTDDTLLDALEEHKLMLLTVGVEGCVPCEQSVFCTSRL